MTLYVLDTVSIPFFHDGGRRRNPCSLTSPTPATGSPLAYLHAFTLLSDAQNVPSERVFNTLNLTLEWVRDGDHYCERNSRKSLFFMQAVEAVG